MTEKRGRGRPSRKSKPTPPSGREFTADDVIGWIEEFCRVPDGAGVGAKVTLRDWQRQEIRKIYDNPAGTRRALVSFGRKNAKTTLAAFLLLGHLVGKQSKPNSQLVSAAQSKEQAGVIFALAAKIVRMSEPLSKAIIIRDHTKELYCPARGTLYRALSADAKTAYGLSPSFIVHDELGQVRGPRSELYEALETAVGAHAAPLSICISTQAPTDADLFSILIDDALAGHDPRTVVSLYSAPDDLDPFSEEAIRAANPAFGDFLNATEVLAQAADAKRMPSRQNEYENLILNRRVEKRAPFISRALWNECAKPVAEYGSELPVYGGLDLSEVNDLTALVLIGKVDGIWHVKPTFWLPEEGLYDRARKDRVPYDEWHRSGHLATVPGASVSYEYVAEWLYSLFERHNVVKLAFDRWNWRHLRPWLERVGFTEETLAEKFVEFGQGFQSMSPALRDLEGEILNGQLAHGDHPVLKMCAANAVVQADPAGNRKLSKAKSTGRIDGMVALAMAMGVAPLKDESIDISTMISFA
jgi:phage terminase large subunit-like protein